MQEIVSEMDKVLEENANRHALPEQREMALKYRNIGIGIMGLADLFVKMGVKYGSPDSIGIAKTLMHFLFTESVIISAANGRIYGNFPGYNPKVWDSEIIKNSFDKETIDALREQNTLRNCSLLSIAPTGSIGTMFNISTGVEPFFALSYNRRTESMNGETYKVEIDAVKEYREATGNQGELPDYFVTSAVIPWKERIDIQAILQEYCDTAISSTVNLKRETTIEDVKELYKYAWKKGLKGVTIYRDGSRDPILSVDKKEEKTSEFNIISEGPLHAKREDNSRSSALQRGEVIPAGDHWLGLKRTLVTGCGTLHCTAYFDPENGDLRECYLSKGSTGGCNNFMVGLSRMISLAARGGIGIDKILDQLKSCGVCPSYAVRSATKKDTSKGSCCPVTVGNALKEMYDEMQDIICECKEGKVEKVEEYKPDPNIFPGGQKALDTLKEKGIYLKKIPGGFTPENYEECPSCHEKTLIHQGGCIQCNSCGYSKCS